jgi:hypothetical protein
MDPQQREVLTDGDAADKVAPRISILIPAYNERFFSEAFGSALAQAASRMEIVVCDDSPGEAIEAAVHASRDPRIVYHRNAQRLGFEGNFTECVRRSRGELLKFLNDDDRLRPGCVARLAEALDDPRITLATSRRIVIDERGAPAADLPATMPMSHLTCVADGKEMGNLVLVNSLNLIGEPTTVMFRRCDVDLEMSEIFTWGPHSYHCLADLSLWLRLLAKGSAFYCATPLSEYRVHRGQEQRSGEMGIKCITERLDLARDAHAAGFLELPTQYRMALARIEALSSAWRQRGYLGLGDNKALQKLSEEIAQEMKSSPAAR